MKHLYPIVFTLLLCTHVSFGQLAPNCATLQATYTTSESRCASTGSITLNATGGSGNYSYKITEPFSTPLTSSSTITGLPPGTYTVYIKDVETGCTLLQPGIVIAGSYSDPRFQLQHTDVTCIGGNNGTITVTNQQYGRAAFSYTIVAPSASGVGTSNNTGQFTNLAPGQYFIQLRDSCGGVQTRSVDVQDYQWSITGRSMSKVNCNTVNLSLTLQDNKGNTNTSGSSFTGFQYGVVNSPGDTTWHNVRSFAHTQTPLRTLTLVAKDKCGNVKSTTISNSVPQLGASVTTSNLACNTFRAQVNNPQNLTSPVYTLKQGSTTIQTNTTGTFSNIPYGSYCIEMRDACYDTTITRCFGVAQPRPSVNAGVSVSNRQCATFNAAVTGQSNLFNPQYCLYNAANTLVSCNTTGVFNNIPYGQYSIRIISSAPCYDTTIVRNINEAQPRPSVNSNVGFSSQTCSGYTASIGGQTNLFNPNYCLYDNGVLVACNSTGVFNNLTYGSNYCIRITSEAPCYDTTIERCFSRTQPLPSAGDPTYSNQTCSSFTVRIPSVTNIPSPQYCLYDNANNLVSCNTTGRFDNLAYGSYSIEVTSTDPGSCPVTPVRKYFSRTAPTPSVSGSVSISNRECSTFTASITGQSNLTSPEYCLYDNNNNQVSCNSTGVFSNIPYGSYRIVITTSCGQTIARNFSAAATPVSFTAEASESCTINTTNIRVNVSSGSYTAKVINPLNQVIASQSFIGSQYTFNNLPALSGSLQYRVAVTNSCNNTDTVSVTPRPSMFSRINQVTTKCPSALATNGSGNLSVVLSSNLGLYQPVLIKRDNTNINTTPTVTNNISGTSAKYDFINLQPGTYVISYTISSCATTVYDTVTVDTYRYPDLQNSAAYQCDNNNFSVGAVATGGVAPFTYEIIGSNPAGPSIVSAPQTDPVFNINTTAAYSLVRMRAIDACGNGTLNDVSVLPLGQLKIISNNVDCYSNNITLSVDTIPNATYSWYRKTGPADSVLIASSVSYNIPYLLPADTGIYVCKTLVNGECLTRLSYFDLKGNCSMVLPVRVLSFSGRLAGNKVPLNWTTIHEKDIKEYVVQRSTGNNDSYENIGTVAAVNKEEKFTYHFTDQSPASGLSHYRLKIVATDGKAVYSTVIAISNTGATTIDASPNPVKNVVHVQISSKSAATYEIAVVNVNGQVLQKQTTGKVTSASIPVYRNSHIAKGMYFVKVTNQQSGDSFIRKMIFE